MRHLVQIDRRPTRVMSYVLLLCVVAAMFPADGWSQDQKEGLPGTDASALPLPPRQGTNDGHVAPRTRKATTTSSMWTTVISLAVIVAGLLLVGNWVRPYLGAPRGLPVDALELLGRRVIDQKVAIHLVRCGRRILVLGVSPEGARTLSEITEPGEVRDLIDACQRPVDVRKSNANQPLSNASDDEFLGGKSGQTSLSKHGPHLGGQDSPQRSAEGNRRV